MNLIVAVDKNWAIGHNNKLLVSIPADMKFFRSETTGKVVKPGKLPITEGVIVYNVETMYNLGTALRYNEPVITKWLTIGGAIKSPTVIKVPLGAKIADIFKILNIEIKDGYTVIDGDHQWVRL